MRVWRLSRARFAANSLSGFGSAQRGARWNSRGVYLAYTSQSLALATLEYLAHIDRADAPGDLVSISARVPDDGIETLDASTLPADWRASPPPVQLREIVDAWFVTARNLALRVPSVIIPSESNVLINPQHARFSEVKYETPEPITLDPRLLQ